MKESIKIDMRFVSILMCILLVKTGYAIERSNFAAPDNSDILSDILKNNDRKNDPFVGKLQPSWGCILFGESGCTASCSLISALYGCEVKSSCRKDIYCECNELYHFESRDVPATNFQNLSLEELWNYRFQKTKASEALLGQIRKNNPMMEYTLALLRDPHITGDDIKYLLPDEYPELSQQLRDLEVNPHGLKSEMGINGQLEYENIGDYFGDLFESIKNKVSEKIQSCRTKRRILELIGNITDEDDLQYILRQILLSGDDELYNFVVNYLKRKDGRQIKDQNLYQPRRQFGPQPVRGRKKRCGGGRRGGMRLDFGGSGSPGGVWHGRPLRRKFTITHNGTPIKIEADEDEVIEIEFLNKLKNDKNAGATASQAESPKKRQEVKPLVPNMEIMEQEIPPPAPVNGNLYKHEGIPDGNANMQGFIPTQGSSYMYGMMPVQGNTYMQGMNSSQGHPYMQGLIPAQGNAYVQGMIPAQGNSYMQGMIPTQENMQGMVIPRPMSTIPQGNFILQDNTGAKFYVMPLPEMNSHMRPMAPAPNLGTTFMEETMRPMTSTQYQVIPPHSNSFSQMIPMTSTIPITTYTHNVSQQAPILPKVTNIPQAPIMQQMEDMILTPQMGPMPLELTVPSTSKYTNQQEAMANPVPIIPQMDDLITQPEMKPTPLELPISSQNIPSPLETFSNIVQAPHIQQPEEEVLPEHLQAPPPFYLPQGNEFIQPALESMAPYSMGNTVDNIISYNYMENLPQMDTIKQNVDYYMPEMETSQMYSSMKPGTITLPMPSTTTFYIDQSPEVSPPLSQTISNTPQTIYEYVTSTPSMPSFNYDIENINPSVLSSLNYGSENIIPPSVSSFTNDMTDIDRMTVNMPSYLKPSMLSDTLTYESVSPSNMVDQLTTQYQNSMANLPSISSLTSYSDKIDSSPEGYNFQTSTLPGGLSSSQFQNTMANLPSISSLTSYLDKTDSPQEGYNFQTTNLPGGLSSSQFQNTMANLPSISSLTSYSDKIDSSQESLNLQTSSLPGGSSTSNMEWMNAPSWSTVSGGMASTVPQSSWTMSQTSNMSQDIPSSNSMSTMLQKNLQDFKESSVNIHNNDLPISQTINQSLNYEDMPGYVQQSTNLIDADNEISINKIQNVFETGSIGNQNIGSEIEATKVTAAENEILQSNQIMESNMSMQQGMSQAVSDLSKKMKSMLYFLVDEEGNLVHAAKVNHEQEIENNEPESNFSYIQNLFSKPTQKKGNNKLTSVDWPIWGK